MPDLDPIAVENLLREGALRRGITVDVYRDLVQARTDSAGVSFAAALLVITVFEKMPRDERNALLGIRSPLSRRRQPARACGSAGS